MEGKKCIVCLCIHNGSSLAHQFRPERETKEHGDHKPKEYRTKVHQTESFMVVREQPRFYSGETGWGRCMIKRLRCTHNYTLLVNAAIVTTIQNLRPFPFEEDKNERDNYAKK